MMDYNKLNQLANEHMKLLIETQKKLDKTIRELTNHQSSIANQISMLNKHQKQYDEEKLNYFKETNDETKEKYKANMVNMDNDINKNKQNIQQSIAASLNKFDYVNAKDINGDIKDKVKNLKKIIEIINEKLEELLHKKKEYNTIIINQTQEIKSNNNMKSNYEYNIKKLQASKKQNYEFYGELLTVADKKKLESIEETIKNYENHVKECDDKINENKENIEQKQIKIKDCEKNIEKYQKLKTKIEKQINEYYQKKNAANEEIGNVQNMGESLEKNISEYINNLQQQISAAIDAKNMDDIKILRDEVSDKLDGKSEEKMTDEELQLADLHSYLDKIVTTGKIKKKKKIFISSEENDNSIKKVLKTMINFFVEEKEIEQNLNVNSSSDTYKFVDCPNCGKNVPEGAFCPICGKDFSPSYNKTNGRNR